MADDQKMKAESETLLQIGNEVKNKEETDSSVETSLAKLQSNKNDSLSPVRLCPDLYSEVLENYMLNDSSKVSWKSVDEIIKFGLIGKEAWHSIVCLFQRVYSIHISNDVKFYLRGRVSIISDEFNDITMKLLAIAIPFVEQFVFDDFDQERHNDLLEVLLKDSEKKDWNFPNQKRLEIYHLEKLNDSTILTLKKLVENGVLVTFGFAEDSFWKDLPDCQFECLKFYDWHGDFLSETQELKCSFNELRFDVKFNLEDEFKPYFLDLKRVFPKCENLVFEIGMEKHYYEYYIECFDELIEAVEDAPQSKVALNVVVEFIETRYDLLQEFNCKDKYGYNYEWKCKSNENKIIKLRVNKVGSDDDYFDSSDDD